jgi:hypothetical protein
MVTTEYMLSEIVIIFSVIYLVKIITHIIYLVKADILMNRSKKMTLFTLSLKYMIVLTPVFVTDFTSELKFSSRLKMWRQINRLVFLLIILISIIMAFSIVDQFGPSSGV